ncbi:MAG: 16S rRNA (cytidine(1402)-2'-O)-methyltransferase [Geminicoccaceae bacterium]|nr:MAG: 16S rRNA (cytidine(1402)-2'-O)-methyltransferase [Geminicoccaceae bacterium]
MVTAPPPQREHSKPSQPDDVPAAKGSALSPGLYLVATPIGNLEDLSPRAVRVLQGVDRILCEDSRVTGRLLQACGSDRPLWRYHEHNAERARPEVLAALDRGERLALVSDAGTPLISDPGFKLVREARDRGHAIIPIPGPSALLAALVVSGLPTDRFFFQGFLPAKAAARDKVLRELAPLRATLVLFESAKRAEATLLAAAAVLGARPACLARELTKTFEEVRTGELAELARSCAMDPPRGEVVLVIGGATTAATLDDAAIDAALEEALQRLPPSEAAREVAALTGHKRQDLYKRALALQSS